MLEWVNAYLLGTAVPVMLIAVGIYFGFALKWFHILHPIRTASVALGGGGRSAFKALCLALAGTLGVGNIVGVAAALTMGGSGAVFWMWVSAFFAMILKYAETVLTIRHRRIGKGGEPEGAAMYYIEDCFERRRKKGKLLAVGFAFLLVLNALTMGSVIQIGAVADAMLSAFSVPKLLCSSIIAAVTLILMCRGRESVMGATEKIVPLMTLGYFIISVWALILRAERIPSAFADIFEGAFSGRAVAGGAVGFLANKALRFGAMRGLISNEAGCGTSPMAHSEADCDGAVQGVFGIFEVFVDTIILCTVTALVILVSNVSLDGEFMAITIGAYSDILGSGAGLFLAIGVLFFGFATVLCWSQYGIRGGEYLLGKSGKRLFVFLYTAAMAVSGYFCGDTVWQIADLSIGGMTVINICVLILMSKEIKEESKKLL
ncbi:MAG: sodium:alanine symporter family protein [Ruminococcaceae bacterium]|nr:sodium:alanine symporter family protein [Oscillospiraceae bacterium]